MKIKDLLEKSKSNDVISELKSRRYVEQPDVATAKKSLDPKLHDINNAILRPDKRVKVDTEQDADSAQKVIDTNGESTNTRIEKVARISLALQKLIIKRAVSFVFGNQVAYNATPDNDNQKVVLKALNRILHDVKSNSLNRKIARAIFGYKECEIGRAHV